jgi:uncharacterized Ntn-hydrolase superfamily protein
MTFTIVAGDKDKGLLGIAQSTNPLSVGGRCAFIKARVGAVATQAFTDPGLGPTALNLLGLGYSPAKVLKELGENDPHYRHRQVGIVDKRGNVAVHTGSDCTPHSGALLGDGYAVLGKYPLTDRVVPAMDRAWRETEGKLFEDRLLAALIAGRDQGGDLAGHRSAALIVYEDETYARTDLRIDFVPRREGERDAVDAMAELLDRWRPLIEFYKVRPHDPSYPNWATWLEKRGTPFQD